MNIQAGLAQLPVNPVDTSLAATHRYLSRAESILDAIFSDVSGYGGNDECAEEDCGSPIGRAAQRTADRAERLADRLEQLRCKLTSPVAEFKQAQTATGRAF